MNLIKLHNYLGEEIYINMDQIEAYWKTNNDNKKKSGCTCIVPTGMSDNYFVKESPEEIYEITRGANGCHRETCEITTEVLDPWEEGFRRRIVHLLTANGMTLKDLYMLTKIPEDTFEKYFTGSRLPNEGEMEKIATILHVDTTYLATGRRDR